MRAPYNPAQATIPGVSSSSEDARAASDAVEGVPYAPGSATSEAAADSMRAEVGTIRRDVLDLIERAGVEGATCDEIEERTGLRHQTASARVHELAKVGAIVAAGTRATRSGRKATTYVAAHVLARLTPRGGAP